MLKLILTGSSLYTNKSVDTLKLDVCDAEFIAPLNAAMKLIFPIKLRTIKKIAKLIVATTNLNPCWIDFFNQDLNNVPSSNTYCDIGDGATKNNPISKNIL